MTGDAVQPLKTNKQSLSAQAQRYLLRLIEDGTYQPGEQLPSQSDLAVQLGISRPTLREALLNLEQEGIIFRKHGVGTFVTTGYDRRLESGLERLESILELAARQGMELGFTALQAEEIPAGPEASKRFQIATGSPLTRVSRRIVVGEKPVAYMIDIVPAAILPVTALSETFNGSVLDTLRRRQGVRVARAVADIEALNAGAFLVDKLQVKRGTAILLMEESVLNEEGAVVGHSRNYFVPDFFRFHVVRR
jgi:GntR family transcriptional regulator